MAERAKSSGAGKRRRRANVTGGRATVRTEVKLSEDEAAVLRERADEQGVTLPRLLVEAALAAGGETPTERRDAITELFALRRDIAGHLNNVNQLAKHANTDGVFPEQAFQIAARTWPMFDRIDAALEQLANPISARPQQPAMPAAADLDQDQDVTGVVLDGDWDTAIDPPPSLSGTEWGDT